MLTASLITLVTLLERLLASGTLSMALSALFKKALILLGAYSGIEVICHAIGAVIFKTAPNVVELVVIPQGNYLAALKVGLLSMGEI